MWNLKRSAATDLTNRKRLTDLENKLMIAGVGEGIDREFGKVMYTLLYLKWMTNKDLLFSTWNSGQCSVPAWKGREYGGEWIQVQVWLSPFAVTITTLLTGYTPIQNTKFKVSKLIERKEKKNMPSNEGDKI